MQDYIILLVCLCCCLVSSCVLGGGAFFGYQKYEALKEWWENLSFTKFAGLACPTCRPDEYCNITTGSKCIKKKKPGEICTVGTSSECIGDSRCYVTASGSRCSAGKDGRRAPSASNPGHYTALGAKGCSAVLPCPPGYYCKFGTEPCKPAQNPGASCLAGQHQQCKGNSKCLLSASGGRCSAGKDGRRPPSASNPGHHTALGAKGCSAVIPCPPGYYCKIGTEPCKRANPPGSSCLAGQHQQCRGDSKCYLSARGGICSAGKDGKNAPGEAGNPRNQHFMPLGKKGCSAAINCPPGYWCKAAGTPCARGNPTTLDRVGAALNPLNWF